MPQEGVDPGQVVDPRTKVAAYIQSLDKLTCTPDKLDLSFGLPSPSGPWPGGPFKMPDAEAATIIRNKSTADKCLDDDEPDTSVCLPEAADVSVCSSASRSRASRLSDLGSLSGRLGRSTLTNFYASSAAAAETTACPFPEEWQYNTIPEVIGNDEEID